MCPPTEHPFLGKSVPPCLQREQDNLGFKLTREGTCCIYGISNKPNVLCFGEVEIDGPSSASAESENAQTVDAIHPSRAALALHLWRRPVPAFSISDFGMPFCGYLWATFVQIALPDRSMGT